MEPLVASDLSIAITASDMKKSLHFYREGLGFETMRSREDGGEIVFAALKAGGAEVSIGRDDFKKGRDRVKGVGIRVWLRTTQDIVAVANRVKAAGISLAGEPAPLPWGPMAFQLVDPDGVQITVASAG